MLSGSQIRYLARESCAGFVRRKLTTGVTILIMAASLLVLALFVVATLNLGALLDTAREGIDVRVFLRDGLTAEHQAELQPRLITLPGVQEVRFITKEMALAEFRAGLAEDADLLDALEENPLPASYHLVLVDEARNATAVRAIEAEVALWPEVEDVVFGQEWIGALERWHERFRLASLVVSLVVFMAAVYVISNTVKLTMAAQQRTIEIMKLVGATNAFIRTPYLAEGMLEGLLGGALAMGALGGTYLALRSQLEGLIFFSGPQLVGFVLFCVALGFAGSWAAVRKYLHPPRVSR
ncbi:MAG: permease-like cell division protein FtsX [Candidatus Krumholzibacteriia bacterium]